MALGVTKKKKKKKKLVFISYARENREFVDRAVVLLKAGGVKVFIDVNDIKYGEKWEVVLNDSICKCERMLVFWSSAASQSDWVKREWRLAVELQKVIVPWSLDQTPLPKELSRYQGVRHHSFFQYRREQVIKPEKQSAASWDALWTKKGSVAHAIRVNESVGRILVELLFHDIVTDEE